MRNRQPLVGMLDDDPRWRTGRLRDVVSARELANEAIDMVVRALMARGVTIGGIFGDDREQLRADSPGRCLPSRWPSR